MDYVVNPVIGIKVETLFDEEWDSTVEGLETYIEITKDLEGEPNIATVQIHNLNDSTINMITVGSSCTISFALLWQENAIECFVGEVVDVFTDPVNPGCVTTIVCESQQYHCRDRYVDLSYEATTSFSLIVDDLTDAIGLPVQSGPIPTASLVKAMHITGPAFLNLKELLQQLQMFCYITDGVLYISSVFEPPPLADSPLGEAETLSTSLSDLGLFQSDNPTGLSRDGGTVVSITNAMMTSPARPTSRNDVTDLWYTLGLNDERAAAAASMFEVNRSKVKKVSRRKVRNKNRELIEVDAVSTEIHGVTVSVFGIPHLQPDTMIKLEGDDHYYRIQRLTHSGNTRDGVYTDIYADVWGE